MRKLNFIKRGCGVGRVAALVNIKDAVSFLKDPIRTVCVYHYYKFLKDYCKYDKVWVVSSNAIDTPETNKCINILKDCPIIWGIGRENILLEEQWGIDDLFLIPTTDNYAGGKLRANAPFCYLRITEWFLANEHDPDKHCMYIQDDPMMPALNFPRESTRRLFDAKNLITDSSKACPREEVDKAVEQLRIHRDEVIYAFENVQVAFVGIDYEVYAQHHDRGGYKKCAEEWDSFDCYLWQGMNDNLDNKLVDFPWEGKVYDASYHGLRKVKGRGNFTQQYYSALKNKFLHIVGKADFFQNEKIKVDFDRVDVLPYYELLQYIGAKSKCTFITHNFNCLGNQISPRYFDCMLADIVPLLDIRYDPEKKLTDDEELKDFMYVSTPEEFSQKVDMLANDEKFYRHIKYLQRKSVFNKFYHYIEPENIQRYKDFLKEER